MNCSSAQLPGVDYLGKDSCGADEHAVVICHIIALATGVPPACYALAGLIAELQSHQTNTSPAIRALRLAVIVLYTLCGILAVAISSMKVYDSSAILGDDATITVLYAMWQACLWVGASTFVYLWTRTSVVPFRTSNERDTLSKAPSSVSGRASQSSSPTRSFRRTLQFLKFALAGSAVWGGVSGFVYLAALNPGADKGQIMSTHFAMIFIQGLLLASLVYVSGRRILVFMDFVISKNKGGCDPLVEKRKRFASFVSVISSTTFFSLWVQLAMIFSPWFRAQGSYMLPWLELNINSGVGMTVFVLRSARVVRPEPLPQPEPASPQNWVRLDKEMHVEQQESKNNAANDVVSLPA